MRVTVFILTRRVTNTLGTERIDPVCSTDFNGLSTTIRNGYEAAIGKVNYIYKEGSHCTDREASVITGYDEYDWFITEQEIELKENNY